MKADCGICFLPLDADKPRGRPRKYHEGPCADRAYYTSLVYRVRKAHVPKVRTPAKVEDHFWAKVDRPEGWLSCWLWQGGTTGGGGRGGYGHFMGMSAHRYSYELANGPIPDGLQIDHLCMVKRCVNPSHLEAVTPVENNRRYQAAARAALAGSGRIGSI